MLSGPPLCQHLLPLLPFPRALLRAGLAPACDNPCVFALLLALQDWSSRGGTSSCPFTLSPPVPRLFQLGRELKGLEDTPCLPEPWFDPWYRMVPQALL